MKKTRFQSLWLMTFLADLLAIACAYYSTLLIRFSNTWGEPLFTWFNRTFGIRETGAIGEGFKSFYVVSAPRIIVILALTLTILYALRDLYAERRFIRPRPVAWNVIVANAVALTIFYIYFYLRRNVYHPRSMFATILLLNTVYCIGFRYLTDLLTRRLRERRGIDRCPVILVGRDRDGHHVSELIEEQPSQGMFVVEHLAWNHEGPFERLIDETEAAVHRHGADMVVLADKRVRIGQIMCFLEMAARLDIAVKILSRELDVLITRARIGGDLINGIPLLHFSAPSHAIRFQWVKRWVSLAFSALGMLLLCPLLLLIAALIKAAGPGPVLFIQERMGINRRPFRMFKFRTMVQGADAKLADVEALNDSGPGLFKMRRDTRVTPIGRVLRRYSLDELPQLINVLRGEMTLVGPRPLPRRDFENYYEEWHYGRHNGLPGLTCLWQVSGRSELDFHSMCILDMYYLLNQSWVLDLKIMLRTFWVVLFAKGAY